MAGQLRDPRFLSSDGGVPDPGSRCEAARLPRFGPDAGHAPYLSFPGTGPGRGQFWRRLRGELPGLDPSARTDLVAILTAMARGRGFPGRPDARSGTALPRSALGRLVPPDLSRAAGLRFDPVPDGSQSLPPRGPIARV